jgi:hypothetical protein
MNALKQGRELRLPSFILHKTRLTLPGLSVNMRISLCPIRREAVQQPRILGLVTFSLFPPESPLERALGTAPIYFRLISIHIVLY